MDVLLAENPVGEREPRIQDVAINCTHKYNIRGE